MIKGIEQQPVPYVLEDDRTSPPSEQTIFFIVPKKSADANKTVSRYAGASKDGRGGFREFNVSKLNDADVQEFLSIVTEVRNFGLSSVNKKYGNESSGIVKITKDEMLLTIICQDLSPTYLTEVFDAANNSTMLEKGKYKGKL